MIQSLYEYRLPLTRLQGRFFGLDLPKLQFCDYCEHKIEIQIHKETITIRVLHKQIEIKAVGKDRNWNIGD